MEKMGSFPYRGVHTHYTVYTYLLSSDTSKGYIFIQSLLLYYMAAPNEYMGAHVTFPSINLMHFRRTCVYIAD